MTKEELELKFREIRKDSDKKIESVIIHFCKSNNPYSIGDTFTDHIGTIRIESIQYSGGSSTSSPCCVYFGSELKKDGTPRKDGSKRKAWQSNDIKTENK